MEVHGSLFGKKYAILCVKLAKIKIPSSIFIWAVSTRFRSQNEPNKDLSGHVLLLGSQTKGHRGSTPVTVAKYSSVI